MFDADTNLERLQAALLASGDVAYDWDLVADTISWLSGVEHAFGLLTVDSISTGEGFNGRINPEDLTERLQALSAVYRGARQFECEYRVRDGAGEQHWYHDRGVAEYDENGKPLRLTGVVRPVNESRNNAERIEYLANHDELTGHFNRTRLREALDHAIYNGLRYNAIGTYLVVDVDKINMVNQAFGYEIADAVLLAVGQRLDRCLRAGDIIGRVGGDRFGVVLGNCTAPEVVHAADKVLESIRTTAVETPAGPIHVTVSIGAVVFPESARTTTDAMTKADVALQKAKRSGRNTWSIYDYTEEQRRDHRNNMAIAERVQRALCEDRIFLAFQPIVDAHTREPASYECLMRMKRPDGGIVNACEFMGVVEELGLIRAIDRKALELTLIELEADPVVNLAMNVSGLTVADRSWLRTLVSKLRGRPDLARRLVVEITETAGLEDLEECARFVFTLRDLGCRVALDDFGAGFTSFRHLKTLSVDIVKIDGSFVRNIGHNPDNLVFVRTLLDLANNFNLETVAECVETLEEADLLTNEGVHMLQGYAFGAPVSGQPWTDAKTEAGEPIDIISIRSKLKASAT